jgi:hypothetical protein
MNVFYVEGVHKSMALFLQAVVKYNLRDSDGQDGQITRVD